MSMCVFYRAVIFCLTVTVTMANGQRGDQRPLLARSPLTPHHLPDNHYQYNTTKMATNIGAQAADAVNEKLVERQKLEQEMLALHQDLQTLISQRNENEMVKEVRKSWLACIITTLTAYFELITSHLDLFLYYFRH